jgi:hypothetical protein
MDLDNIEWLHIARDVQNHIYSVYTVFSAGKSASIRSYTVSTYSFGQPYILLTKEQQQPASLLFAQVFNHAIPEMNSISLRRRVLGQP